ncbi:MAG: Wadjet anti-phage system protein JetD domain-containing protein [Pseudonocardiaceae bacterium]
MKSPAEVLKEIERRLARTWHEEVAQPGTAWPHTFSLGTTTRADLDSDFGTYHERTFQWHDWARERDLTLTTATRRVRGTSQVLPTHVQVPNLDTAARVVRGEWLERLGRARKRLDVMCAAFRNAPHPAILRAADAYSDAEFEVLCAAARWFTDHPSSGLTPRQVPIEGLHAKWIQDHRKALLALAGVESLGLVERHPSRVHFCYLDPDHLAGSGRQHDSVTVGDAVTPPYRPEVVLISENKDTALAFPTMTRAVAVEGSGFSGAEAISQVPWLASAPHILYWGDIDAAGFEIVNTLRSHSVPIRTILMDQATYDEYERFGATTDRQGKPLGPQRAKTLLYLTMDERDLYEALCSESWTHARRVEQERIPLTAAAEAVVVATRSSR